ncbi:outer membrane beta-barrel protein [Pontibacter sp. CAU 1760]
MKTLLSLLLLLCSLTATAQSSPAPDSTESRYFVGLSLSSNSYPVMGDRKYKTFGSIIPIANVYYGYRLSKRATVQVGIGYGVNGGSGYGIDYISADSVYHTYDYQRLRGIAVPITFKFTPFNPHKRLQLYAHASIAPIFGHIKARATRELDGAETVLYDEQSMTFDLIATGGLTLNYRLSKRLDLYADATLLYKNFYFSRPAWNYYEGKSAGIGINYNLK